MKGRDNRQMKGESSVLTKRIWDGGPKKDEYLWRGQSERMKNVERDTQDKRSQIIYQFP